MKVESNNIHKQRQITDALTVDVNKVVLSDKVSYINGKAWRYIVGYHQVYGGKNYTTVFQDNKKHI